MKEIFQHNGQWYRRRKSIAGIIKIVPIKNPNDIIKQLSSLSSSILAPRYQITDHPLFHSSLSQYEEFQKLVLEARKIAGVFPYHLAVTDFQTEPQEPSE